MLEAITNVCPAEGRQNRKTLFWVDLTDGDKHVFIYLCFVLFCCTSVNPSELVSVSLCGFALIGCQQEVSLFILSFLTYACQYSPPALLCVTVCMHLYSQLQAWYQE